MYIFQWFFSKWLEMVISHSITIFRKVQMFQVRLIELVDLNELKDSHIQYLSFTNNFLFFLSFFNFSLYSLFSLSLTYGPIISHSFSISFSVCLSPSPGYTWCFTYLQKGTQSLETRIHMTNLTFMFKVVAFMLVQLVWKNLTKIKIHLHLFLVALTKLYPFWYHFQSHCTSNHGFSILIII